MLRPRLSRVGSSPLARGLLQVTVQAIFAHGIIPARAGFTASLSMLAQMSEDHPRSRGVYVISHYEALVSAGSSPLARGLPPRSIIKHKD